APAAAWSNAPATPWSGPIRANSPRSSARDETPRRGLLSAGPDDLRSFAAFPVPGSAGDDPGLSHSLVRSEALRLQHAYVQIERAAVPVVSAGMLVVDREAYVLRPIEADSCRGCLVRPEQLKRPWNFSGGLRGLEEYDAILVGAVVLEIRTGVDF